VNRRDGFVLVAALWLIVALSAIGLNTAVRSQGQRLAAANQLDAMRSREAAFAGGEYVRARLTAAVLDRQEELRAQAARSGGTAARTRQFLRQAAAMDDPWYEPADLVPHAMTAGDAEVELHVRDAGLRLNINHASEDMLRQFFALGMRLDYAWADRLTQAMLDWRDEDDLPRVNGAERDEYLSAGAAVLPPNQPFADVDELRYVMGMTPELFAAIRPYMTVAGSGRINVNAAPEPVLLAIPSFSPAVTATLLRWRDAGEFPRSMTQLRALLGPVYVIPERAELADLTRRIGFATNEVEIVAVGRTGNSPVAATVRSVIARSDAGALLVWRRIE
jgi:type II secretory pathway component PulK